MEEMENCLFCNNPEKNHPNSVEYVCSSCVQKLINLTGEQGKELYARAEKKESFRQMKAITIIKGIRSAV